LSDDDIVRSRRDRLIALALVATTAGVAGCSQVEAPKAERSKPTAVEEATSPDAMSLGPTVPPPTPDRFPFCPPPPRDEPPQPSLHPCLSVF